jgi:hypothetical protein
MTMYSRKINLAGKYLDPRQAFRRGIHEVERLMRQSSALPAAPKVKHEYGPEKPKDKYAWVREVEG